LLPLFPFAETGIPTLAEHEGVLSSLLSIARSLQFMRYHFASFNLDPENVALSGISAGGGAGLWLGTHDDLADPLSKDPVLQESTRVKAVAAERVQSTYDVLRWEAIVSSVISRLTTTVNGNDVPSVFEALGQAEYLLLLMNIESREDIYTLENEAYRSNVDMLGLLDAGDAPIFVNNYRRDDLTDPFNLILHHRLHAIALKERADEVGLESVIYAEDQEFGYIDPSGESLVSFLVRHIQ
jgi:acetyl esterase/lipase